MIPGLKQFISKGSNNIWTKTSDKQPVEVVEQKGWLQVRSTAASVQGLPMAIEHFLMS